MDLISTAPIIGQESASTIRRQVVKSSDGLPRGRDVLPIVVASSAAEKGMLRCSPFSRRSRGLSWRNGANILSRGHQQRPCPLLLLTDLSTQHKPTAKISLFCAAGPGAAEGFPGDGFFYLQLAALLRAAQN